MPKELPKAYVAKDYEDAIYAKWEKSGHFKPANHADKKPFVITMPPPNATGTLHLGHAVMLAVEDIMVRFHRMKGHPTLWLPGTDHAAIATQNKVEKDLLANEGKTRHDYGREEFLDKVRKFVAQSQVTIRGQIKKMGSSCDWSREAYTMDENLTSTVYTVFEKMFQDGLIYRGDRIVNWCTRCTSTLADDEVTYKTVKSKFYFFKYGPFEIGTARPETKYGDHVVIVHPDDKRYKKYHGKKIEVDWIGEEPITATVIADEASDPEIGSGVMTITPAHSFVDFELAHKYGLDIVQMINEEGKMTSANEQYEGLTVDEARARYVEILEKKGLVTRVDEDYEHNLSLCYRCGTTIQPLVSKQWFVDVNHPITGWDYENLQLEKGRAYSLKEVSQQVVRSGMIEIIPDRFNKTYFQWMDNLRDWCISRQIWWGHRIPVWYKKGIKHDESNPEFDLKVSAIKPGDDWEQDEDTLDTWFSSGLFTFSPLDWLNDGEDYKRFHPTQVMETGYDILFFWVARMILLTTYMTGEIPFEKVYLHGMVRTREGKKMSKSHPETCIDPLDVISEFGADALRLSLFVGSAPGNDMRLYPEKIAGYRNFVNKLWNVARYILMSIDDKNISDAPPKPKTLADSWILSRLQQVVESTGNMISEFKFSQGAEDLYAFTWNDLADWYLEISKIQKNDKKLDKNTDQILHYVLKILLRLWHPFTPFVTEELWAHVRSEDDQEFLIADQWPELEKKLSDKKSEKAFELIRESIGAIRNLRAEYKVEPAKKIAAEIVSKDHKKIIADNEEVIKFLARLDDLKISAKGEAPENSVSKFLDGLAIHLPLAGMVDAEQERKRLKKEIDKLAGYIKQMSAKLDNKKFVDNAPNDIVKAERERLETARGSLKQFQEQLKQLG